MFLGLVLGLLGRLTLWLELAHRQASPLSSVPVPLLR